MAVAFDAIGTGTLSNTTGAALTFSHTITGSNTVLLAGVSLGVSSGDGSFSTTATYAGNAMTSLAKVHSGNITAGYIEVFGIVAGPGTANVVITPAGGTALSMCGSSMSFTGAAQTVGTAFINLKTANTPTATTTATATTTTPSTSGNLMAGYVCAGQTISSATAPSTSRGLIFSGSTSSAAGALAQATSTATGSNVTMAWTIAGADDFGEVIIEVQAGSSGAASPQRQQVGYSRIKRHHGERRTQIQPVFPPAGAISPFTVTATVPSGSPNGSSLKIFALTGATEAGGAQNTAEVTSSVLTWSLTPNATNSLPCFSIYDETGGSSGEFTAATNNTLNDNTIQHDAFCNGRYTGTVTSGTPITIGTSAPSNTNKRCGAVYEVLASGGSSPVIDASSPAVAISATNVATTASFTPPAGAVLAALITGNVTGTTTSLSDTSGLGLTWTKRSEFSGSGGIASVWTTTIPGGGPVLNVNAGLATGVGSPLDITEGMAIGLTPPQATGAGSPLDVTEGMAVGLTVGLATAVGDPTGGGGGGTISRTLLLRRSAAPTA